MNVHLVIHGLTAVAMAMLFNEYLKLQSTWDPNSKSGELEESSHTKQAMQEMSNHGAIYRTSIPGSNEEHMHYDHIMAMEPTVKERLWQEGTSVWCQGSDHTERHCRFQHLCYWPAFDDFVFLHGDKSMHHGIPTNRFEPGLLQLSAVHGHNALNFNFIDLSISKVVMGDISYIRGKTLLLKRFNPDNVMHTFHDDLLPMYYTLLMMQGPPQPGSAFDVRLLLLDQCETDSYLQLYEALSNFPVMFQSEIRTKDSFVCFENLYVGIPSATLWYQYGFQIPQGPIHNSIVTAKEIRHFTNYMKEHLCTNSQKNHYDYIVLFSRKLNRRILNEMELAMSLAQEIGMKIVTLGAETHNITEIISVVSSASVVVGMHGSLLAYSIFLRPGTAIIELFPYGVNPDNYTPYKTLAEIPGMNIVYKSWRNLDRGKSVTHPEATPELGGIAHLPQEEQDQIQASPEVAPHLCCTNHEWLFRIYQDTYVDIPAVISLSKIALRESKDIKNADVQKATSKLFPTVVANLKCSNSSKVQPALHISWEEPFNLKYISYVSVKYEVWIQPIGSKDYSAWILSKLSHTFSDGLEPRTQYMIWVRCILDTGLIGPFNAEVLVCGTK